MIQQVVDTLVLRVLSMVGGAGFLVFLLWCSRMVIKKFLYGFVDERFDKRLEDHKHSLGLITEQARYEYQRDLENFNLYAARRHTAVESVYAKARVGHGAVAGLFGSGEKLTFEELNRNEMDEHLVSLRVPQGTRVEILKDWDSNREAAHGVLWRYLDLRGIQEAEGKYHEAQNEVFLNELYLTDEARRAFEELFKMLHDWLYVRKNPGNGLRCKYQRGELNEALDDVREILRTELTESTANPTHVESSSGTKNIESGDGLADG